MTISTKDRRTVSAGDRRTSARRPADAGDGSELLDLVGRLRRAVRRRVRKDWPHEPLTPSAVEVLRLLDSNPGLRVREAAVALGLVPNTVSTLVGKLRERGLVARTPDEHDARAARLVLTPTAKGRIADWRDRRGQVLGSAFGRLARDERDAIRAALPALRHLLNEVERS